MKKHLLSFIIIALVSSSVFGQGRFQKVFSKLYEGRSVKQTADGGYIISGGNNAYLLKLDAAGNVVWNKTYGDSSYVLNSVEQTTDGGFVAAGKITNLSLSDVFLVRTNAAGDTLWTKNYGGVSYDYAYSVRQTPAGGFIIAGYSESFNSTGVYIIETDQNGNILWTKSYGNTLFDYASEVQNTSDGGFIITGTAYDTSNFSIDMGVVKLNGAGDTLWTRSFYCSGTNKGPGGKSVVQTTDGGYIVLGNSDAAYQMSGQSPLIRLNPNGDTLWTRSLYFQYGSNNLSSIKQTPDGGFIIAGSFLASGVAFTGSLPLLIKINGNGDTLWTKKYGEVSHYNSYINDVERTNDGGFVMTGYTQDWGGGTYLIKTDSLGNSTCDDGSADFSYLKFPIVRHSGTKLASGGAQHDTTITIGIADTTNLDPCHAGSGIIENVETGGFLVYPNPASDNITVSISQKATIQILNIEGQIVKSVEVNGDKNKVDHVGLSSCVVNVSALCSGVYVLEVITEEGVGLKKFVKE